ncbi:hypothetical protein [Streptomyces sp. NPDC031705]|uniref:hypothetical protein n=1 Tax=Streptomyces sp. NPDC031705 TaxID=3155729 RepID=UPI0033FD0698
MIRARLRAAAYLAMTLACGSAAPAAAEGSLITVIDNSHADSVLEVDRTANVQSGSGSAGSDHEGSTADVLTALLHPARPDGAPA